MVHPGPIDTPLFSRVTSATGRRPRVPPDSYRVDVVAQAIVEAAVRPRDEIVLGGETALADVGFVLARPAVELMLRLIDRWYRSGTEAQTGPGSLWRAPSQPRVSGDTPGRDSLLAPLQVGRRLLPSPSTPVRLVRNLAAVAAGAFFLRRQLVSPQAEVSHPGERSLVHRGVGHDPAMVGS